MAPQRLKKRTAPPGWLTAALVVCVVALLIALALLSKGQQSAAADVTPTPSPTDRPVQSAAPSAVQDGQGTDSDRSTEDPTADGPTAEEAEPVPSAPAAPVPPTDWSRTVPAGPSADPETWFRDAVFIGDSRTDGLHLFSGVQGGTFLVHTGLSIFDIQKGKEVIRIGDEKVSVLDALSREKYGKVYLSLGINELGYFNPQSFADAYGQVIDSIRAVQPNAVIYVQSVLPVNTEKCLTYSQAYYVSNDNIAAYNNALAQAIPAKGAWLLAPPAGLLDSSGEVLSNLSADGVHFNQAGYVIWLDWLLTHTGAGVEEPVPEPTPAPVQTPAQPQVSTTPDAPSSPSDPSQTPTATQTAAPSAPAEVPPEEAPLLPPWIPGGTEPGEPEPSEQAGEETPEQTEEALPEQTEDLPQQTEEAPPQQTQAAPEETPPSQTTSELEEDRP